MVGADLGGAVGAVRPVRIDARCNQARPLAAADAAPRIADSPEPIADRRGARHNEIRHAEQALLVRAQEIGQVCPDIAIDDLLNLVYAIAWAIEQTPATPEPADRLLSIVIRGTQTNLDDRACAAGTTAK
jgi:hypothetical protein